MFTLECGGLMAILIMIVLLIKNKREEALAERAKNPGLTQPLNDDQNQFRVENLSNFDLTQVTESSVQFKLRNHDTSELDNNLKLRPMGEDDRDGIDNRDGEEE
jgi:hypothetical protein